MRAASLHHRRCACFLRRLVQSRHMILALLLSLLPVLTYSQALSITEKHYFQRSGFYTFVGEAEFRGIPISVFIAGHSESDGVLATEVAWAFRSKIEIVSGRHVASTVWRINVNCRESQLAYLNFEDIDEYSRTMRRGPAALWSPAPTEATPSLLSAQLFTRLCGKEAKPTVVALGDTSRPPEIYRYAERFDTPKYVEIVPKYDEVNSPNTRKPNDFDLVPAPIRKESRSGTGFFVNGSGVLITNSHVVEGCNRLTVVDTSGAATIAMRIASDQHLDLAALQIHQKTNGLNIHRGTLDIGEAILVFGYPLSGLLSSGGTATTGIVSALSGIGDDISRIQISTPIQPGNSGGAVVDYAGTVVGVVVSKLDALRMARMIGDVPQNVNFAVSLNSLKAFLAKNKIESTVTTSPIPLGTTSLVSKVRSQTRKVLCNF